MELSLYTYSARVVSSTTVYTIRVDIDLGLKTWVKNESIRLHRINAPEVRGGERAMGLLSSDFLRELI